jgi:hypothetical protein
MTAKQQHKLENGLTFGMFLIILITSITNIYNINKINSRLNLIEKECQRN